MRSRFHAIFTAALSGLVLMTMVVSSNAQTANPEVLMKFSRQADGKVATINAVGQKVFSFEVSGLITQTDVSNFRNNFNGHQGVVSVEVGEAIGNTDRSGTIVFERGTKTSYVRDLLVKAKVEQIMIDGVLTPVEELGKDK